MFLNYFRFICDVICFKNGNNSIKKDVDELDIIKELFSINNINALKNIKILESCFDCWVELSREEEIIDFFTKFISNKHEKGKIIIEDKTDLFYEMLKYSKTNSRTIMLYAFITYLLHRNEITEEQFRRRIRIIYNLVLNSNDEMSEREEENGGNRLPNIIKQVDSIIIKGQINEELTNSFNSNQLIEEREKLEWTIENPDKMEKLFCLEDNKYLNGQISIIGLENYELFDRFIQLFNCDLDKIDCALMATGNYIQQHNSRVYQLGSSSYQKDYRKNAWIQLFHKSRNKYYERTKNVLTSLLKTSTEFTNEYLDKIKEKYLNYCEEVKLYDFRYYYIKYSVFRPGESGKYWWNDYDNNIYDLLVMVTPTYVSEYAYKPFLKAIDKYNRISQDDWYNNRIIGDNYNIYATNNSYILKDKESDNIINEILITQNEDNIDKEDRIAKIRDYLYDNDDMN